MATPDSPWPTMLAPGITCRMCIREHPTTLLSAEELLLQYPLSLVQLLPCGHMYCTLCYEKLIFASGQSQQRLFCQAPGCHRPVLVTGEEVRENDVVLEMREYRLPLSSGNLPKVWALRVSVLNLHERVTPGYFVLGSGGQAVAAADQNAVAPEWVFLAQSPTFDRLLKLVHTRVRQHSLFYRVNGEGRSLDITSLGNIFNPLVQNFSSLGLLPTLPTPRLVQEARANTEPVQAYNPNSYGITAARPPPFLVQQKPIDVAKVQPPIAPPPPTTTTTPTPNPVYGLHVDDLIKALAQEPSFSVFS